MAEGFPVKVGHWKKVLVFKEGSEPVGLDLRILAQWVATALSGNPIVVNVGVASRFNHILVIMSRESVIAEATLESLHDDISDPCSVVAQVVRNHLIFTVDEALIKRLDCSDGLKINLTAA